MSRLRVGFIGGGARANQSHYPSVAELSHLAEITAVCDLDSEKLALTAERWGIEARFTDLHEMLAQVELDAVYCIAPPTVLLPIVLPCLEAGKHVFTEKPLGATSDEARQMAEAAEANGCLTMVGFNRRFAPGESPVHDDHRGTRRADTGDRGVSQDCGRACPLRAPVNDGL